MSPLPQPDLRRGVAVSRVLSVLPDHVVPVARRRVVEEVRELSPRQRDCILLRYYLELTEVEIAEVLGISNNSVKTHCRRGMEALRRRLGDTDDA